MRFSQVRGHSVVSTSDARTVGRVGELVVDPGSRRVVALALSKTDGNVDTLTYDALTAIGADAVTVPSAAALSVAEGRLAELRDKRHGVLGKRVLSQRGDELGSVQDVEFDPADGRVGALLLADGSSLDGERLHGVGSYAVVVRA